MNPSVQRPVRITCVGISPEFTRKLISEDSGRLDIKLCGVETDVSIGVQLELHRPHVVLISRDLLCERGVGFFLDLRDLGYQSAVVVAGEDLNASTIAECIPLGLAGLVDPRSPIEEITKALEAVSIGEVWLRRERLIEAINLLTTSAAESHREILNKLPTLTEREHEVFVKIMAGLPNQEIAKDLDISCETVKVHIKHIFSKLGVHRRTELLVHRL